MIGYNLIGLSLSQCTTDWIKGHFNLDQIYCIFSGTMIQSRDQIDNWIQTESKVNPTIKSMPSMAKDFINHLFDYPHKFVQPRLNKRGLIPVYRGRPINWIHRHRWVDWNLYLKANQSCPFCGSINHYQQTEWIIGSNYHHIELTCDNCHSGWFIAVDNHWDQFDADKWLSPKY